MNYLNIKIIFNKNLNSILFLNILFQYIFMLFFKCEWHNDV